MSVTCVRIVLLTCFALLSTLTCTEGWTPLAIRQGKELNVSEGDDVEAGRSIPSAGSVDPKKSFLAGEDTPVWIAYYADPKNKVLLTYEKLEKGIVKQAVEHWKSKQLNGTPKRKRSVDDDVTLFKGDHESFVGREAVNGTQSAVFSERSKREINWSVYYPSVLVVMEYGNTWPSNKNDERILILERIIYALAYWNSVDVQLRPIENPWVRIRLAGIVIGRDRDDTHHLFEMYEREEYLHYEGTLQRMSEYWGDKQRQKLDFRRGTYNIVALMTDAKQVRGKTDVAVSTNDFPCNDDKPNAASILITYDNLKFSELQETLRVTTRILGHGSDKSSSCAYKTHWKSRSWSACDVDSFRTSLESKGSCMKDPPQIHNPGKPVETILPGSILSWSEQCGAIGPKAGQICPLSSCRALRCEAREFAGYPCEFWHPAMDGSACETGMICLNAECVSDTRLTYDWWMHRYEYDHSR